MDIKRISFNDIPEALAYLVEKIDHIETILETNKPAPKADSTNKWMDIRELKEYLPDHPAPTTVYGWVRQNLIPYYKKGKKLSFKKSEIDAWLEGSTYRKSQKDLEQEAAAFINGKRRL